MRNKHILTSNIAACDYQVLPFIVNADVMSLCVLNMIVPSRVSQKKCSNADCFNYRLTSEATAKHVLVSKVRPTLTPTSQYSLHIFPTYKYIHGAYVLSTSTLISIQHTYIHILAYHSLPSSLSLLLSN